MRHVSCMLSILFPCLLTCVFIIMLVPQIYHIALTEDIGCLTFLSTLFTSSIADNMQCLKPHIMIRMSSTLSPSLLTCVFGIIAWGKLNVTSATLRTICQEHHMSSNLSPFRVCLHNMSLTTPFTSYNVFREYPIFGASHVIHPLPLSFHPLSSRTELQQSLLQGVHSGHPWKIWLRKWIRIL